MHWYSPSGIIPLIDAAYEASKAIQEHSLNADQNKTIDHTNVFKVRWGCLMFLNAAFYPLLSFHRLLGFLMPQIKVELDISAHKGDLWLKSETEYPLKALQIWSPQEESLGPCPTEMSTDVTSRASVVYSTHACYGLKTRFPDDFQQMRYTLTTMTKGNNDD